MDTINSNNCIQKPKHHDTFWAVLILALVTLLVLYFAGVIKIHQAEKQKTIIFTDTVKLDSVSYDSFKISVTVYNPVESQCDSDPLQTADGSIIDPLHPQRWCGASRDIIESFGYGKKINCIFTTFNEGNITISGA